MVFKRKNDVIIELYDFCSGFIILGSVLSDYVDCATGNVNPTYKRKENNTCDKCTLNDTAYDTKNLEGKSLSLGNEEANDACYYLTNSTNNYEEDGKY